MASEDELRALIGELSAQLQEAVQARTNIGVSLRLAQARIAALEAEKKTGKQRGK